MQITVIFNKNMDKSYWIIWEGIDKVGYVVPRQLRTLAWIMFYQTIKQYCIFVNSLYVSFMDTVIIELTNQKAYKLLEDMEELNLIRLIKEPTKLSSLRGRIKSPMSNEEIDKQLNNIRDEWQRDF